MPLCHFVEPLCVHVHHIQILLFGLQRVNMYVCKYQSIGVPFAQILTRMSFLRFLVQVLKKHMSKLIGG